MKLDVGWITFAAALTAIVVPLFGLVWWAARRAEQIQEKGIGWPDIIVLGLAIVLVSTVAVYLATRTPA